MSSRYNTMKLIRKAEPITAAALLDLIQKNNSGTNIDISVVLELIYDDELEYVVRRCAYTNSGIIFSADLAHSLLPEEYTILCMHDILIIPTPIATRLSYIEEYVNA